MPYQNLEIRGMNHSWAVYHNGKKLREVTGGYDAAEAAALNTEKKLRPRILRPCLCCRASFVSEGPHNRMCDPCRQQSNWLRA